MAHRQRAPFVSFKSSIKGRGLADSSRYGMSQPVITARDFYLLADNCTKVFSWHKGYTIMHRDVQELPMMPARPLGIPH